MKIYVASSWRNYLQPAIVILLRKGKHDVYDFRNPPNGVSSFAWSEIDPNWEEWTPIEYAKALKHPLAVKGFKSDITALEECEACILVLPSGRSASWEFGYASGQGKKTAVIMLDSCEPELMYSRSPILTTMDQIFDWAESK